MSARNSLIAFLLLAMSITAGAQVARDRQTAPGEKAAEPAGTGIIAGIVITADERQQPVRRASVMLASGHIVTPRTAVTDDAGRFEFIGLAPGNYTLVGQKPAWVPAVYGARSATDTQGVPIAVANGQRVEGVRLSMMRGAVISGTVRLPGGQPAADLAVQVLRVQEVDGRRQLSTASAPGQTNDVGAYRVFGLAPGEYVVQARSQPAFMSGTAITRQVTSAEVRWADLQVKDAQAAAATAPPEGSSVAYSTVYFPGTAFASDATLIVLRAGEERGSVDFALALEPTARVTGTIVGPDGAPSENALIQLEPVEGDGEVSGDILGMMMRTVGAMGRVTTKPDGTFLITGVTPGRYTLTARGLPRRPGATTSPGDAEMAQALAMMRAMTGGMLGGGAENPATLWATEPVAVSGQDVGPIGLALREGLKVEGSVVMEGGGAPADMTALRLQLAKPTAGNPMLAMFGRALTSSTGVVKEDGTFAVGGLMPGSYQFTVAGTPMRLNTLVPGAAPAKSGWVVKSIRWGDKDLADTGLDLQADVPVTGIVITLTNRPAQLAGTVIDAAGRPTGAFPIVVFATDRAYWSVGSRRVLQAQPASDGRFTVVGLPAGEYFVAAVTRLESGDLANRQFLEDLMPSSIRITVREAEQKTQDLRLSGGG